MRACRAKRRARAAASVVVVALAGAAAGCASSEGGDGGGRLRVVASFYPVAEAARRAGGDRVEVTNLTPPGAEPHDIELTSRQVDRLEDADVVLFLGQGFQPAVEKVADRRDDGAVDLLQAVPVEKGDPHFWLDPRLMAEAVGAIAAALAHALPDQAAGVQANARRYQDELATLDREFKQGLAECRRRDFVTSHAAFHYLARRYRLTQLPVAGLSPEAEPDAARLADLAEQIKARGITTVFYEELVSPRVARALAREAGVATGVLSPLEGLTKDEIAEGRDYAAVMRANLAALRKALDCR